MIRNKKTSTKLFLGEIVFYIGIATMLAGLFYGIYNYCIYTSGRTEHTTESKSGPIYHPEEDPGNPGRKESTAAGWKIAGIGIVLIVLSIFISIIDEVLHDAVGAYFEYVHFNQLTLTSDQRLEFLCAFVDLLNCRDPRHRADIRLGHRRKDLLGHIDDVTIASCLDGYLLCPIPMCTELHCNSVSTTLSPISRLL